ncbi:MAG: hypothetical protein AABZ44_08200 [Elusimicrobiota bacterium]
MKIELIRLAQLIIEHALWPAVAAASVFYFRVELSRAVGRINKFGPVGLDAMQPQPKEPLESERARRAAEEAIKDIPATLVIQEIEKNINQELKIRDLEGRVEAVPALVKSLAATVLALEFESLYGVIFGSQIAILSHLNGCPPNGEEKDVIYGYYKNASVSYPAVYAKNSFEYYIGFLTGRLLIKEENSCFFITNKGREFLLYLTRVGHSLSKAL